eukprot:Skav228044  [mRNA]  locus=scaffold1188:179976:183337:+ [translate_table: standard]
MFYFHICGLHIGLPMPQQGPYGAPPPGTSSTASLSESGSAKRRLVARRDDARRCATRELETSVRPHDQPREGRNSPDAAPRDGHLEPRDASGLVDG